MADEPGLAPLSPTERDMFTRASTSPLDVIQGEVKAYIDRMIEFQATKAAVSAWSAGDSKIILKDLTAETGVYVYEDDSGQWLYANGAAASQTTYADLYAYWGANAWGADSGGNFLLPDCRGRSLFFCGTHADTDLGDNDGTALASRRAKHQHTLAGTPGLSGAPGVGSLAISPNPHSHSQADGNSANTAGASAFNLSSSNTPGLNTGTTSLSITGAPDAGTLAVSAGSLAVGATGSSDAPSHLFVGSLLVRF